MEIVKLTRLIDVISESKDGEWGKGKATPDSRGMLVIRGTDFEKIKSGSIDNIPLRFIPNSIAIRKKLQSNDILIETAGGTENKPTGRVVFISQKFLSRFKEVEFSCASFSRFIRINAQKASPSYVYWYLHFLYESRISYMFHTQHTGVARFQWTKFANYELLRLPDSLTQQRIASILSAYDDLIEVNNQRIKLLEATARELYKEWFVRMRFPGYKKTKFVKGIPEGWIIAPLSKIATFIMGQSPKSEFYNDQGIGLPFHQGVGTYGIRFPEHIIFCSVSGRIAEKGDILFSVRAPVGRLNVADRKLIIGRGLAAVTHKRRLNSYLFYLLQNEFSKEDVIGNGAIFNSVGKDELKGFKIFEVGTLAEKFNDVVSPMDQQIHILMQQNSVLHSIRDRLLPRLLSGKLQLKEPKEAKVLPINPPTVSMVAETEMSYRKKRNSRT